MVVVLATYNQIPDDPNDSEDPIIEMLSSIINHVLGDADTDNILSSSSQIMASWSVANYEEIATDLLPVLMTLDIFLSPVTITVAPVTVAPITVAPITVAPITVAPITVAPITLAPITQAPITQAPITQAPITVAPITQAPLQSVPHAIATSSSELPSLKSKSKPKHTAQIVSNREKPGPVTLHNVLVSAISGYARDDQHSLDIPITITPIESWSFSSPCAKTMFYTFESSLKDIEHGDTTIGAFFDSFDCSHLTPNDKSTNHKKIVNTPGIMLASLLRTAIDDKTATRLTPPKQKKKTKQSTHTSLSKYKPTSAPYARFITLLSAIIAHKGDFLIKTITPAFLKPSNSKISYESFFKDILAHSIDKNDISIADLLSLIVFHDIRDSKPTIHASGIIHAIIHPDSLAIFSKNDWLDSFPFINN